MKWTGEENLLERKIKEMVLDNFLERKIYNIGDADIFLNGK